ncbi:MAG TPA: Smr/MutS family protein [Dissulfurispiraceae bacterium]|nr:Smr/MutS family protein [Dissulfurispiraceae bacterium]
MGTKKRAPEAFSFQPFENLKDIIERRRIAVAVNRAAEEKVEYDSDDEVFAAAMKEVREIKEFRQIAVQPKKVVPRFRHNPPGHDALQILKDVTSGHIAINLPDTQEYVEWSNPVYWPVRNGNIAGKLHRGFFSVQDCLDLHGFFVAEAEGETERFLKEALGKGLRCIKIIHGRGLRSPDGPVLKSALIGWLTYRYRKNVIAFASARQCDGGLGALYVLLK